MRDTINYIVFGWYPYVCLTVFVVGSILRFDREQYTWKAGSSQLLRRRSCGARTCFTSAFSSFLGHFSACSRRSGCLKPSASATAKQIMAIVIGGVAGIAMLVGGLLLAHRRLFDPRIRANSSFADTSILLILLTASAWIGDNPDFHGPSRRARDGALHELGGYSCFAAGCLDAGRRCASDIQGAPVPRNDDFSDFPVHEARARMECTDLVSRPKGLSGRPHPQANRACERWQSYRACGVIA